MPWLLSSPGHQQPWHWTCRINWSLFSTRKNQGYWLIICGLRCHIMNSVNFGSSNGLLPDSTKLLPEPMLSLHQLGSVACIWGYYHKIWTYQSVKQNHISEITSRSPREKWVDSSLLSAAYMRQWTRSSLVQVMACRLLGAKPLPKPMLTYCHLWTNFNEIRIKIQNFSFTKMHLKIYRLRNGGHFVQEEMS